MSWTGTPASHERYHGSVLWRSQRVRARKPKNRKEQIKVHQVQEHIDELA